MPILSYLSNLGMGGGGAAVPIVVVTPRSEGSQRHRSSFRYDRWGKKKKQVQKKCPEVIQVIEQVAEACAVNLMPLSAALASLEAELRIESIKASQIYRDLLELELDRLAYEKEDDEDFDDLLLL